MSGRLAKIESITEGPALAQLEQGPPDYLKRLEGRISAIERQLTVNPTEGSWREEMAAGFGRRRRGRRGREEDEEVEEEEEDAQQDEEEEGSMSREEAAVLVGEIAPGLSAAEIKAVVEKADSSGGGVVDLAGLEAAMAAALAAAGGGGVSVFGGVGGMSGSGGGCRRAKFSLAEGFDVNGLSLELEQLSSALYARIGRLESAADGTMCVPVSHSTIDFIV